MPRVTRRAKRRSDAFNESEIHHLLYGFSVFGEDRFAKPDGGNHDELIRHAWSEIGEQLVTQWLAEYPGHRPWAWWRYDAPERRRRIDGIQHPFDNALRRDHVELVALDHPSFRERAYALYFGVPQCLIGAISDDFAARYEGELAYLDRLNLLTPSERHALYGEPLPESEGEDATS